MEKKGSDSTETLPGNSLYTLKTMLPSNWTDPLSPQIPSTFELPVPPIQPFIYSKNEHALNMQKHSVYMLKLRWADPQVRTVWSAIRMCLAKTEDDTSHNDTSEVYNDRGIGGHTFY